MMTLIAAAAAFFLLACLISSAVLLSSRLLRGNKKHSIKINDGAKVIEAQNGGNLLWVLADEKVYLPSACGGTGSCGACECRIVSGATAPLATESIHISPARAKQGYRLACQTKVFGGMEIELPQQVLSSKRFSGRLISTRPLSPFIKELRFEIPEDTELSFEPGAYVQAIVPEHKLNFSDIEMEEGLREEWRRLGIDRMKGGCRERQMRAYSIANPPEEEGIITLNVRIALPPLDERKGRYKGVAPGVVSSYLFSLKEGDELGLSGPFGDFRINESRAEMIFIGGGAGMPPLRSMIRHLLLGKGSGRRISFWFGVRAAREAFYIEEFLELERRFDNFSFHCALSEEKPESGSSFGYGYIHEYLFESYLKEHNAPDEPEYYVCGPPVMTQALCHMLDGLGVDEENIQSDSF